MKQRILKLIIFSALAAAIAGAWYWINSRANNPTADGGRPGGQPAPVTVATAELREFTARIESVGTVRSDEATEVSTTVSEIVEKILFEDGDIVEGGQELALLSSAEEEAALAAAKANVADHEREIERLVDLVKDGAAPEVRLQARRTLAEVARQRVQEAEAKLKERRILAPFAGILGLRRISQGALVTPGTVITTLDKIDRVKLDFTVPEVFMAQLKPGLRITARSKAYPKETFEGVVAKLDSRVDPVTRALTVRALFDNPDFRLRPGMLLTTSLEGGPRTNPAIPERAVTSSGQNHYAFVLVGPEENTTVERRNLKLGRRIMGFVEILDGIQAGERLAADGLLGLRTGSPVKIIGAFEGPVAPFDPLEKSADPVPEKAGPS